MYPVDAHISEEEEGQHAEEDTRPAWRGTGLLEVAQEAVRVSTVTLVVGDTSESCQGMPH